MNRRRALAFSLRARDRIKRDCLKELRPHRPGGELCGRARHPAKQAQHLRCAGRAGRDRPAVDRPPGRVARRASSLRISARNLPRRSNKRAPRRTSGSSGVELLGAVKIVERIGPAMLPAAAKRARHAGAGFLLDLEHHGQASPLLPSIAPPRDERGRSCSGAKLAFAICALSAFDQNCKCGRCGPAPCSQCRRRAHPTWRTDYGSRAAIRPIVCFASATSPFRS